MRQRIVWLTVVILFAGLLVSLLYLLPRIIGEVTYPLAYDNFIVKYSRDHEVNPFLTAAVIYVESHYRPTAVSPSGALGLMQMIPSTGAGVARRMGVASFQPSDLFNPETSIDFGTFHLQGLQGVYDSNLDGVIAAYNGGDAVGWAYLRGDLGRVPSETEHYVVAVKAAMSKYRELYPDRLNPPTVNLTQAANPAQQSLANQIITSVVSFLTKQ